MSARYIKLFVPTRLSKTQASDWFDCVKQSLPSGLIAETTLYSHDDTAGSNFYLMHLKNGKFCYVIPLVRDLDASEIHNVVQTWNKTFPTGDFLIDYSQAAAPAMSSINSLEAQKVNEVMEQWAKIQHSKWMDGLIKKGWKYGTKVNVKDKTHPLMQPWEQLPEHARAHNLEAVKDLLALLDKQGYTISQKLEG